MSKSSQNHGATFDFTNIGRRREKRFSHVMLEISELGLLLTTPAREGISEAEQQALQEGRLFASKRLRELDDERDGLIAEVLVSVPSGMLTADAPDVLDWSNPDTLGYVKDFDGLVGALSEARSAKN
jgi:hypothetical protein